MPLTPREMRQAIETFVRGHCLGRSRTHPYEWERLGGIWHLYDGPRARPADYRKEEFIAWDVPPQLVDSIARQNTRGRFFVGDLVAWGQSFDERRSEFKQLGYRLLITEPFFLHPLKTIPRLPPSRIQIELLDSPERAKQLAKATRTRALGTEYFGETGRFRQYLALDGQQLVGWVRSVPAGKAHWCANLEVIPTARRQGVASRLLQRMLRDDRRLGAESSVLLASHAGAKLYPKLGYQPIGTLLIYAPRKDLLRSH